MIRRNTIADFNTSKSFVLEFTVDIWTLNYVYISYEHIHMLGSSERDCPLIGAPVGGGACGTGGRCTCLKCSMVGLQRGRENKTDLKFHVTTNSHSLTQVIKSCSTERKLLLLRASAQ